ncbi:DUF922 domain-containing Zn-dependent protease [Rhizobium sp. NRK18]|uniref:DUF922 domain-containing Zn-dependent protease n=1 Tax=Rhizobium sp. NRK18 TaxID=2964667 RepID=UPI0021C3F7DA|nr:DUF922 domain-containing protein [Rhizobium sp. NRK18]MCQ2003941.1 DUF922 domain-containing protein [Rhizobium sp. NRK18]
MRDIRNRTRVSILLATALIAAIVLPARSEARPVIQKTYRYFPIHGKTAEDLDRELMRRGPKSRTSGLHHPGLTRIRFDGKATYQQANGRCRVTKAQVILDTTIYLPKWTNRRHADRSLAIVWDTLSTDIRRHEERHAEIARTHAFEMERALLALPPQRDCDRMKEKVDAVSAEMLAAHDADQNRFDRVQAATFDRRMIRMLRMKIGRGSQSQ